MFIDRFFMPDEHKNKRKSAQADARAHTNQYTYLKKINCNNAHEKTRLIDR